MAEEKKVDQQADSTTDSLAPHMLEQGEIDGLLKGANTDNIGLKALMKSTAVSHERLPLLEVVFDRLVRTLSTSLREYTSDSLNVTVGEMTSLRFGDYMSGLKLPSIISIFHVREWNSEGLLVIDNGLIFTVVDMLLGGARHETEELQGREYTTIERTLTEEFLQVVFRDLNTAFAPIEEVHFSFKGMETNPQFAMIEKSHNAGIIVPIKVELGGRGGLLEFFIPYATIEPARAKLSQAFPGEKFGQDKIWVEHLTDELWSTEIEAEALLDKVTIKLSDVLKWKQGTTLSLETFEGANIVLQCGDRRLYSGKIGNVRKRVAVQVEENYLLKEMHK